MSEPDPALESEPDPVIEPDPLFPDRGLLAELWHGVAEAKTQLQQGEADKAAVKAVVKVGGLTAGLPSTQVTKTIDAVQQAQDGDDVTPWEYLAGPAD